MSNMADSLSSPLLDHREGDVGKDIPAIHSFELLRSECWKECKKLWAIAAPSIFTRICTYALTGISQICAGHLGTSELAAVAIQTSVIGGFAFGIMLGMGSALETLCGQAFGAGQVHMLGVYLQRSWIILLVTGFLISFVYIFALPILKLLGLDNDVADLAGVFTIWMLPQLFAISVYFPMQKFLQSQRKVSVMAWIAVLTLLNHIFLSWLLIFELGLGLAGTAITLNLSWWLIDIAQFLYIIYYCQDAWKGFSWLAFQDMWSFVRLSFASGVMLCLEFWYMMSLVLFVGHLKNAAVEVDAISICMNLNGWEWMIFIGFNTAISVRVSNEFGAGRPRAAKFAVVIVVITALSIGLFCMGIILGTKDKFAVLFTDSKVVADTVSNLAMFLGVTMVLNSVQPVLSGVAIGGGWQALIAYVNIGCYYVVGLPLGLLLGFKFNLGAKGIWSGMISGTALQTFVLILITFFTNWDKEAAKAEVRVKVWGSNGKGKGQEKDENPNINP